ncbi:MAG: hypothetical protein QXU12_03910 [Nitrososphaerota archaeon]
MRLRLYCYWSSSNVFTGVSRPDILAPDTSPSSAVRDSEGRIIGVKALLTL